MIAAASERPKRSRAKVASEAAAAAPVPRTQAKIKTEPEVAAVAADAKVSVPATPAVFSRPLLPAVKYTYDALKVLFDPMAKVR